MDATVPLASGVGGRASRTLGVWQGSAAQQRAELVPKGVTVVAAFQNCSADVMNGDDPVECDVIVCSDDPTATKKVCDLATKIPGVRALDGGKLENARIVEQITALLIGLNIRQKGTAEFASRACPLRHTVLRGDLRPEGGKFSTRPPLRYLREIQPLHDCAVVPGSRLANERWSAKWNRH